MQALTLEIFVASIGKSAEIRLPPPKAVKRSELLFEGNNHCLAVVVVAKVGLRDDAKSCRYDRSASPCVDSGKGMRLMEQCQPWKVVGPDKTGLC